MSASKWKPYSEYRDSHIDWIGKIPKHWQVLRSKYVFSEKDERSISGKEELLGLSKSKGIVRKKEMEQRSSVSNTYVGYKQCIKGDIVMNKLQAWNGVLDVSNYNGLVSPDYTVFEISEEVDIHYGSYLLKSPLYVTQLGRYSKGIGSGFMRLYTDNFGDIEFLLPPLEEQMSISKFIHKVDMLCKSTQKRLKEKLELLEEKRSALISKTVTRGLNLDVEMKDSGVQFIGEIPKHWNLVQLKHIITVKDGTHDTPIYMDPSGATYPLITSKNIREGIIDFDAAKHISKIDYESINRRSDVDLNDIIMPMIGTIGNPAVVNTSRPFAIKNVALFKTSLLEWNLSFLLHFLNSDYCKSQFELQKSGGVQGFVSLNTLRNLFVLLPP